MPFFGYLFFGDQHILNVSRSSDDNQSIIEITIIETPLETKFSDSNPYSISREVSEPSADLNPTRISNCARFRTIRKVRILYPSVEILKTTTCKCELLSDSIMLLVMEKNWFVSCFYSIMKTRRTLLNEYWWKILSDDDPFLSSFIRY
jgi:hypothetical protein